ncbi:uncharacterized protein DFL_002126 [Arthrobotrys flagrans]|uniref:Ig-like domain-containing protein n=1 Tax=Arthrobotrys flagrans TaxID=97331 RepID=A0A437A9L5_ARTFL|nr:hypothetical protein DFL_002126 [Arthrobotrys flagrans]
MMRLTINFILIASLALPVRSTTTKKCVEDNCLRAIRATNFPTRPGTADCNSYFATIVTPPVSTSWYDSEYTVYDYTKVITETITTTLTTATTTILPAGSSQTFEKRDEPITNTASSIPAYASPCSGSIRYSSACSCIGATHTVITVESPIRVFEHTVYITVPTLITTTTITKTSTIQTAATGFAIRVSASDFWDAGNLFAITPPSSNLLLKCRIEEPSGEIKCENDEFGSESEQGIK